MHQSVVKNTKNLGCVDYYGDASLALVLLVPGSAMPLQLLGTQALPGCWGLGATVFFLCGVPALTPGALGFAQRLSCQSVTSSLTQC